MTNRKIKKVIKALNFALFSVVYVLSSIVYKPRKRQKKIIGFAGARFTGNLKYLYQEMAKYNNVKLFFVTGNKADIEKLKKTGIDAHHYVDTKSIPLFLVTNAWVTSTGWNYIPFVGLIRRIIPFYMGKRGSKWIDVWHGIGFKDVGREIMLKDYDLGIVTSDFLKKHYLRKDRCVGAKLKITGFPRNDPLVNNQWARERIEKEVYISITGKNILYAPTWGHGYRKKMFPWQTTATFLEEVEKFCEEKNCNFLIRMHPNWYKRNPDQYKLLQDEIKYVKRIFHVPSYKYADAQPLLYISDVLITDWSSIANDFLLLNRPMIFLETPSPIEKFVLTPEDRVGYVVKSKDEFFEKLHESVTHPNLFEEKRRNLLETTYKYIDGNSSKRCIKEILKLL